MVPEDPRPWSAAHDPLGSRAHLTVFEDTHLLHGIKTRGRNNVLGEPHCIEVPQGTTWPAGPAPESDQRPGDHSPVWTSLCRCEGSPELEGRPTPAVANMPESTTIQWGRCTELLGVMCGVTLWTQWNGRPRLGRDLRCPAERRTAFLSCRCSFSASCCCFCCSD